MKHPARVVAAGLGLLAAACFTVAVQSQERPGRRSLSATDFRELRGMDRALVQLERSGELQLRKRQVDTMIPGRVHERLDQFHQGVPVFGADLVRQVESGTTVSVFGTIERGIGIDTTPAIGPGAAIAVFERETGHKASPSLTPKLFVLPKDDGTFALAWRVSQYTKFSAPVLFVNAANGQVELRYDNLQRQSPAIGSGTGVLGDRKKISASLRNGVYVAYDEMRPPQIATFDLGGDLTRVNWLLLRWLDWSWGDVASDTDNVWDDGAVVDAHTYMGLTYDYYYKRFGRKGFDDHEAPIRVIVHGVTRTAGLQLPRDDFYTYAVNAFWLSDCGRDGRGCFYFGDGLPSGYHLIDGGQYYDYLAGALDVVAHEATHALTTYSCNLIYRNEAGALNEAFSDILATGAEFYYQPEKADYLIGEDVVRPVLAGARAGMRSLADPRSFGDPDHYSRRYLGSQDNGGVHINSLIAGHAFYLAIEGGTNRTSGKRVEGVGGANREQIEKVFYRAFAYYLTSNATFHSARVATIRAAQELYGPASAAARAVTQAWDAVGVS
ncbi:MAG TPA: M4 family metallopeptidase [Vicinamibacterales bacterium]|nr:peptidase M4 family protein [Acidobacteriota bacterium]HOC17291.1 M4 family metallopeptidase [Vicinamibacterales bacterium]